VLIASPYVRAHGLGGVGSPVCLAISGILRKRKGGRPIVRESSWGVPFSCRR